MGYKKKTRNMLLMCGILFLFSVCGTACGKEQIEPGTPLQELMTEYETEGVLKSVAALEDGTMFALTAVQGEKTETGTPDLPV